MQTRQNFFLLTLFFLTSLFAQDSITVDVLSFNIRYGTAQDGPNSWPYRDELVFRLLQNHNPDIVGLQEALKFQIDEIQQNVPGYAKIGVGRDDGDTLGEYSAILYKPARFQVKESGTFWFSDSPDVIASKSWGNNITRICTWANFVEIESNKSFYMFNLHLDHQSQNSRVKSCQLLASKIAAKVQNQPFFITGDFNAGEDNEAIIFLTKPDPPEEAKGVLPLYDSFRLLHPDAENVGTFNDFAGTKSGDKIDYIFVPSSIHVQQATILDDNENGKYPSDHFPVTARLCF